MWSVRCNPLSHQTVLCLPPPFQDKADKLWAKELKKIEDEKKRRAEIERRRIRQMEIAKGLEATGSKGGEGAAKTGSKGGEGAAKTGKGSGKAGGKSGGGSDAGGEGQRVAGKGAGAKGGASGAGSKGAGGKGQGAQPGARKPGSQDAPGGKRPQVVSDSDDEVRGVVCAWGLLWCVGCLVQRGVCGL